MNLLDFLTMVIGPEFTYCHVLDPRTNTEFTQGFVDDLIDNPLFTQKLDVLSFFFTSSTLVINARRREQ